jgi:hypothetical protein
MWHSAGIWQKRWLLPHCLGLCQKDPKSVLGWRVCFSLEGSPNGCVFWKNNLLLHIFPSHDLRKVAEG